MRDNEIIIQGSFNGIRGELSRRLFFLVIYGIIFLMTNAYKKSFYSDNEITSIFTFLMDQITALNFKSILPILFIFLIFIFLAIFTFSTLFKTIKLFYNINRKVTVNYSKNKISTLSYTFPFFKDVEENKFDNIITVNIRQDFMDRFCNSGKLYIEYLVISKIDSSLACFEIPYVYEPSHALKELLS
ncbi:MAG: hypothetical protein H7Y18_12750 [Clostridiaceae bacterium]|nr:hypothetical protein [Clostridiaceae bacterium]